jgi:SAM-dependent methyltransferase
VGSPLAMSDDITRDVRLMYEAFPYPSPVVGDHLIRDVANMIAFLFPPNFFAGKRILDAGCGTGQRLVALAKAMPHTAFVGIDLTAASSHAVGELAKKHLVKNVAFEQANLLDLRLSGKFDLIISTGVIHHLEDPRKGVMNLASHLTACGIIILWLYHRYGEADRLLERDLLLTLWDKSKMSLQDGIDMLRDLGIAVTPDRYAGAFAKQDNDALDDTSINVDAYLHPIVNAYRFGDTFDMLASSGLSWAAVHSIDLGNSRKMLDLAQVSPASLRMFCLQDQDLFASKAIQARYRQLENREKLKAIELRLKPNGFSLACGNIDTYTALDRRCQGNLVHLGVAP